MKRKAFAFLTSVCIVFSNVGFFLPAVASVPISSEQTEELTETVILSDLEQGKPAPEAQAEAKQKKEETIKSNLPENEGELQPKPSDEGSDEGEAKQSLELADDISELDKETEEKEPNTDSIEEQVEQGQTIVYDFRPPDTAFKISQFTLEEHGLAFMGDHNAYPSRTQSYGVQIQPKAANASVEFAIAVPADGIYQISHRGATYGAGGRGKIAIDDFVIGDHDYKGNNDANGRESDYTAYFLKQGTHKLTFISYGTGCLYPAELTFTEVFQQEPLKGVALAQSQGTLMSGQQMPIPVVLTGESNTNYHPCQWAESVVDFESQNPEIAEISSNGIITGIQAGQAEIHLSATIGEENFSAVYKVIVSSDAVSKIEIINQRKNIMLSETGYRLEVKAYNNIEEEIHIPAGSITFISTAPEVATIAEDGTISPVSLGTTTIQVTVTTAEVSKTVEFPLEIVASQIKKVKLEPYRTNLFIDDTVHFKVLGTLTNDVEIDITENASYPKEYQIENSQVIDENFNIVGVGTSTLSVSVEFAGETFTDEIRITASILTSQKKRRSLYTEQRVQAAQENSETYPWAKSQRENSIAVADEILETYTLNDLWYLLPPQSIPRSYASDPKQTLGSPVHGYKLYQEFGNYPWETDPSMPWKLIDPTTKQDPEGPVAFPTNDFASYYRLGLDKHGVFDPKLAKERNNQLIAKGEEGYLVNKSRLHTDDPTWGVDDGYGWWDGDKHYTFVAYYAHWHAGWHLKSTAMKALEAFADAYMYTGERKYGTAGIILLDRIADFYPAMDTSPLRSQGFLNSDGGANRGKGVGSIWETLSVQLVLRAYDKLWPAAENEEAIDFLSEKADEYFLGVQKKSAVGIRNNIEENYIKEIFPAFQNAKIRGNNGMHQSALALAAVVYDTLPETKEWLDYNMQSGIATDTKITGGNILATMVDDIDRDGHGTEASPGYNAIWIEQFQNVADVLEGYDLYEGADLYDNVKFRKMFTAKLPLMLSENYIPCIGDTGSTGAPLQLISLTECVKAFEIYGAPEFAQAAYMLNNGSTAGIHSDIYTQNPEEIAEKIQKVIDVYGPLELASDNKTGYGFAALRDGKNDKRIYGISYAFPTMEVVEKSADIKFFEAKATVQFENTSPGGYIEYRFDVPVTDVYEISLQPFEATSYGVYNIYLGDQKISTHNFCSGAAAEAQPVVLGTKNLTAGEHTIRFECTGTNGSGYKMGLIRLEILDRDSVAARDDSNRKNTLRDLWMYYGRTAGHGHYDTLNIGIHGYQTDLAPDLGYPETADSAPHRHQWVKNTISHNTVIVDESTQNPITSATPLHFDVSEKVKLVDVRADEVYPSTEEYRRTVAMVAIDDEHSYYVDFFRIVGGNSHIYSFHSGAGEIDTDVQTKQQTEGTYAGETIAYGETKSPYGPSGFSWLKNVERASNVSGGFSVDWDLADTHGTFPEDSDVHLKLTMLSDVDEVAFADGIPPRRSGNPDKLRYLLAKREGNELDTTFVSVIEPYNHTSSIRSIEAVPVVEDGIAVSHNNVKAVKVTLDNGTVDYIVYSTTPESTYVIDGLFSFQGFFGVLSLRDGKVCSSYLLEGTHIGSITPKQPLILRGTVQDFTKELSIENHIEVAANLQGLDVKELIGKYIFVQNQGEFNGSYKIEDVQRGGENNIVLSLGDITLINRYQDSQDFSKGYIYNISEGDAFYIPLSFSDSIQKEEPSEPPEELPEKPDGFQKRKRKRENANFSSSYKTENTKKNSYQPSDLLRDWERERKQLTNGQKEIFIRQTQYSSISKETLQQIKNLADKNKVQITVYFDTMKDKTVTTRFIVSTKTPISLAEYGIRPNYGVSEKLQTMLSKYFSNPMQVMSLDKAGFTGQVAVKLGESFAKDSLVLYEYNKHTNTYRERNQKVWIDRNGYAHFEMNKEQHIILSKGKLVKR